MTTLRVLLVLPPARISHGPDTFRAMPDCELTVVADRQHPGADRSIVLPSRRAPMVGESEHWTAALAWLRDLRTIDPGPVDLVASLELFSVASLQALRLAARLRVPHVVRVTENLAGKPPYVLPPWRQIAYVTARRSDAFMCVTEGARLVAEQKGCAPGKTTVVYHGVDVERFSPRPDGLASDPVVTFVGELRPLKGVLDLVAAFDHVVVRRRDARLDVIGDGPLRQDLEQLAGTRSWLRVRGPRDRSQIPDILQSSRVLVVPSKTGRRFRHRWAEQFGFALVEAMSCGLPVVTTKCGAIPEVVPSWNPVIDEGDIAALADGIVDMLGVHGDDVGARNRSFVVERYDLRRQGVRMRSEIERVLAVTT